MKMGVFNDEPHIAKCARSQTEGQDRKKGFDDAQALISKRRCQQACEGHFDLEAVSLALEGHTDKQNVAITENFFYSPQLRKRLEELGDWRTAAALAIIAEAYQSFELPGLDSAERSERLARMHQLTTCVLGRDIHDCHIKHWAGDVHSLTRRLLITMAEPGLHHEVVPRCSCELLREEHVDRLLRVGALVDCRADGLEASVRSVHRRDVHHRHDRGRAAQDI